MLANGQGGALEDVLLAHPVLGCGPGEVADLVGVAPDGPDVVLLVDLPTTVKLQLGESARVQRPLSDGARECPAVPKSPVRPSSGTSWTRVNQLGW